MIEGNMLLSPLAQTIFANLVAAAEAMLELGGVYPGDVMPAVEAELIPIANWTAEEVITPENALGRVEGIVARYLPAPEPEPEPPSRPPPEQTPVQTPVPSRPTYGTCQQWWQWVNDYMAQVPTPAYPLPVGGEDLPPVGKAKCISWEFRAGNLDYTCVTAEWHEGDPSTERVHYTFRGPDESFAVDRTHRYVETLMSSALPQGGAGEWLRWLLRLEPTPDCVTYTPPPEPEPKPEPEPEPIGISPTWTPPEPPPEPPPPGDWFPPPEPPPVAIECCPPVDLDTPGFLGTLPFDQQAAILGYYGISHLAGKTMAELELLRIGEATSPETLPFNYPITAE